MNDEKANNIINEVTMEVEKMLVKDRKCGSCSVCCVSLAIDEPELKKSMRYRVPISGLRVVARSMLIDRHCAKHGTADGG